MGFTPQFTVYSLSFPDGQFDGFECEVRGMSIAELQTNRSRSDLWELFVSRAVQWNLTDAAGVDVPFTVDGLKTLELSFVEQVIGAWIRACSTVSDFLPTPSSDGANVEPKDSSMGMSFPMEPLSENQPNLNGLSSSTASSEPIPGTPTPA